MNNYEIYKELNETPDLEDKIFTVKEKLTIRLVESVHSITISPEDDYKIHPYLIGPTGLSCLVESLDGKLVYARIKLNDLDKLNYTW